MLRSLGLDVRLVISLQPVPIKATDLVSNKYNDLKTIKFCFILVIPGVNCYDVTDHQLVCHMSYHNDFMTFDLLNYHPPMS